MLEHIDINALCAPISDESPAGDDLRYTRVYDEIKEARRSEDDDMPQGEWQRESKVADWDKVIRLSIDALTSQSKDFWLVAWLTEALAMEEGFEGIETGFRILQGLMSSFWETAYPLVEDDDYDFRIATFEFLNDKLVVAIKNIPLVEPRVTPGYSYLKWKESRDVGFDADSDSKRARREEMVAEGKITAEEFDSAVNKSSSAFYKSLADSIIACIDAFGELDAIIDEKFGSNAPRISDIGQILDECKRLVIKICKEQKGLKDAYGSTAGGTDAEEGASTTEDESAAGEASFPQEFRQQAGAGSLSIPAGFGADEAQEIALWNEAVRMLQSQGFRDALQMLLAAANSQSSERGKQRYRFLVAKLCLKAGRPDLAKPIVEQLHTMINELHLENWESPYWVSEILEALYQCLMSAEYADEDPARAQELFRRICIMDVTKVLGTRS